MKIITYQNLEKFKRHVTLYLEKYETHNNLALGMLEKLPKKERPEIMATVEKGDTLALVILQTHPKQAILSYPEVFRPRDADELAEAIANYFPHLPGLIGEAEFTYTLAEALAKRTGKKPFVHMDQRLYQLLKVADKGSAEGMLRLISNQDFELIQKWVYAFAEDIGERLSEEEAAQKAEQLLGNQQLYGWERDGQLISMAATARPTRNNITINFVYTPPAERRKGYAKSCVAALTQLMLDRGFESTSLYTDLSNPTSNKIYMEIGYEPVMDSAVIHLK